MPAQHHIHSYPALLDVLRQLLRGDAVAIVGICGLPGAGKTTLCKQLVADIGPQAVRLSCDSFARYSWRADQEHLAQARATGDVQQIAHAENPQHGIAWQAIATACRELQTQRRHTYRHAWNTDTGELDATYALQLPTQGSALVLLDGIYLLHDEPQSICDVTIYVNTPVEITRERGQVRAAAGGRNTSAQDHLLYTYNIPYFTRYIGQAGWIYYSEQQTR